MYYTPRAIRDFALLFGAIAVLALLPGCGQGCVGVSVFGKCHGVFGSLPPAENVAVLEQWQPVAEPLP